MTKHHTDFAVEMPNNDFRLWHVNFVGAQDTVFANEQYK
jgi:ubiquitin-protein ligase